MSTPNPTVVISLPPEFRDLMTRHRVTAEQVLNGFIADLCGTAGTHGSDERMFARAYYDRVGYPHWNT